MPDIWGIYLPPQTSVVPRMYNRCLSGQTRDGNLGTIRSNQKSLSIDFSEERLLVVLALAKPAVGTALPLALRSRITPRHPANLAEVRLDVADVL